MTRMFPRYEEVDKWKILETRIIHAYNINETPIEIVKVQIGYLDRYNISLGLHYSATTNPIIRWITKKEYERLQKAKDMIIW